MYVLDTGTVCMYWTQVQCVCIGHRYSVCMYSVQVQCVCIGHRYSVLACGHHHDVLVTVTVLICGITLMCVTE